MTEFIKLPGGKWVNPAQIAEAIVDGDSIEVWLVGDHRMQPTVKYRGADATALAAALDELSMDPDITAPPAGPTGGGREGM